MYTKKKGCDYKSKSSSDLNKHLSNIHDIGVKWHHCPQKDCNYKSKNNGYIKRHLANIHGIGVIWHYCSKKDCDFKCKTNDGLKQHLVCSHNIDVIWHYCSQKDCNYKCKNNGQLKSHLAYRHNIGVKWYCCPQNDCEYKFKTNSDLTAHVENVHDIGDKVCDYCSGNCFRLRPYKDKNVGKVSICRKCYLKATGYKCRAEEDMVNCLKNNTLISPFIVSTDKIISNDSCNTKRRPDILISSGNLHIIVECDEKQHRHYNSVCESGRIDEILDEFKSGKVVFIRWNPDHYKSKKKLNRKERLKKLENTIVDLTINPPKEHIKIVYMFYDQDNPVIVDRWIKEFVY